MEDSNFKEDGNILRYTGKISKLPHCTTCTKHKVEAEHEYVTYEHPYKLKPAN